MITIPDLVARLGATKHGAGFMARCPAHKDDKPSLSMNEGKDGRVLLKCHAGCSFRAVIGALGIKAAEVFPSRTTANGSTHKPRLVEAYDYTDEAGTLLFQVCRFEPKDFRQRKPDPDRPGEWLWKLGDLRRVPYRLPELIEAVDAGRRVFIAEGEKDVAALVAANFAATCNPGGAGKWRPDFSPFFKGADVVIVADKDRAGREHAQDVALKLQGHAGCIRIIELPDINGKAVKDAADFFAAGAEPSEFYEIAEQTPIRERATALGPGPTKQAQAMPSTPARWFAAQYPTLTELYGDAVQEVYPEPPDKDRPYVKGVCEDFLAATIGEIGTPEAPTVYMPEERKFYTYDPREGIYSEKREPQLEARLSGQLLECALACRSRFDTKNLEFKLRDTANVRGVVSRARGLLEQSLGFFETNLEEFVPCENGMLRVSDRLLLPFAPSYRRRNKLAVAYDPKVSCPLFLETLVRPALDDDDIDLVQRWCGLALIGVNLAQRFVILSGTAGGGKGTFIRVLTGIIGATNCGTIRPELLDERFEIGRLLGKSLLYGPDVTENFLDCRGASRLKALTGGDPLTVELKGSNERPEMLCRFNCIVTCNSRLTVHLEGDSAAWRRRLVIVEYHKPPPASVIADLSERILATEAPGVLNWMLDGLDRLRADNWQLHLTPQQTKLVDDLLLESESDVVFAKERLLKTPTESLTVGQSYDAYVRFCNDRGWSAMNQRKFGINIGDTVTRLFGLTVRNDVQGENGKAQRGWKGLGWA